MVFFNFLDFVFLDVRKLVDFKILVVLFFYVLLDNKMR